MTKLLPGTDILATITARDSSGNAIDLTALSGFVLYAFIKPNRIIDQFAYPQTDNYSTIIESSDLPSGEIKIRIPGAKTKDLNNNIIHIVMYARTDDPSPVTFGTADGTAYELVHVTTTPNPVMP